MEKNLEVIKFWEMGMSLRKISAIVNLHRGTIKKIIAAASAVGNESLALPEKDLADKIREIRKIQSKRGNSKKYVDPDWEAINHELKKDGATLKALHEEYTLENPDGMSYSAFCDRRKKFLKSRGQSMIQIYSPGECVQVDYSGTRWPLYKDGTADRMAEIFVGILGYSGKIFLFASKSQRIPDWIAAHDAMFKAFGGATKLIICDNLKSAITKFQLKFPVVAAHYKGFADHYGSLIAPARPKKPKDKALVESAVRIVTRLVYFPNRNLQLSSLGELNELLIKYARIINEKNYQGKDWSRESIFEKYEKSELIPLPLGEYLVPEVVSAKVDSSYHIDFDSNRYSVHHDYANKRVELKAFPSEIIIEYEGGEIARHPRCYGFREVISIPEHLTEKHLQQRIRNARKIDELREKIGPNAHEVVASNKALVYKEQHTVLASKLFILAESYGSEIIEAACGYALQVSRPEIVFIAQIAKDGIPKQAEQVKITNSTPHGNIRGKDHYKSLGESE